MGIFAAIGRLFSGKSDSPSEAQLRQLATSIPRAAPEPIRSYTFVMPKSSESDLMMRQAQDTFGQGMLAQRRRDGESITAAWRGIHGLDRGYRVEYRCPGPEHIKCMSPAERRRFGVESL